MLAKIDSIVGALGTVTGYLALVPALAAALLIGSWIIAAVVVLFASILEGTLD